VTFGVARPVAVRLRRAAPTTDVVGPALVDRYGRLHDDLRISVTDRCNFRCVYCLQEDAGFLPPASLLTFEEIERVARAARDVGVRSVRITGGEPLQRRGIVDLVARLASLGFADLSMTTNGYRFARLAAPLRAAGLQRVNISCDSLNPERFAAIRRRGTLDRVLNAMAAAEDAGFHPVKVNVVLLAGVNDDEIEDFAAMARDTGRVVRFIEFMPLDAERSWAPDRVVAASEILGRIAARWPLRAIEDHSGAPATRYAFEDGAGEVGVIASVSQPFCASCNRLRLTADGAIRNCLFSDDEVSVRDLLRRGGSNDDLVRLLRLAVGAKRAGHGISEPDFLPPFRTMSMIGG
jgi:cyclic pyranopterin phosphate synthase